jgi:hypothetical protein
MTEKSQAAPVSNHPPQDQPPVGFPQINIYSAYVNFLIPLGNNAHVARLCYFERTDTISQKDLRDIIRDAVASFGTDMPPALKAGTSFRRRSYLAFVILGPEWKFKAPEVRFLGTDNHTFFSGKSYVEPTHSAFHCINHMRKADNGASVEPGEELTYDWELHIERRVRITVDDDSQTLVGSGTNMGPPVSPPGLQD